MLLLFRWYIPKHSACGTDKLTQFIIELRENLQPFHCANEITKKKRLTKREKSKPIDF